MSLISYSSLDNREIVLRHNDAIVLRDPQTHQLTLRGTKPSTHCPTCHQLIRDSSPERQESPHLSTQFISSEYFRLLQSLNERNAGNDTPLTPVLRLVEPDFESFAHSTGSSASVSESYDEPYDQKSGSSIKKEAFSQSYFKRFFIEEKVLGRGGKGVVLLVRHELDGVSLGQFACKRVPVGDNHAWLEKVLVEVQLLQGLSHPNLVSYRHVWLENVKLSRFGPSVPCAFILQQYCNGGDLLHYIVGALPKVRKSKDQLKDQIKRRSRSQPQLEEPDFEVYNQGLCPEEIYSFFKDIVSALDHLHASNYIHRDLKPSNCLLHKEGKEIRCLISDFGEVQVENMARKSTGSTGTISYCAPEVLKQDSAGRFGNFTTKSDIFSLGMILYFMCFRRLPYKSADTIEEEDEDITLLRAEINAWSGFSDEKRERPDLPNRLYNLLKKLLAIDPDERPSTKEILTAIRTDKGFGNITQPRHASNPNLGSRLKSIDSSGPLAVAKNDQALQTTDTEDDSLSNSGFPEFGEDLRLIVKSSDVRSLSPKRNYQPISNPRTKPNTPLLMPPPSTLLSVVQNNMSLCKHQTFRWLGHISQLPDMRVKFVLFMIRIWTLTSSCPSGLTRPLIWWPLMSLAALDLTIGTKGGWKLVIWLNLLHFSVLAAVVTWFGGVIRGLCSWESDFWT